MSETNKTFEVLQKVLKLGVEDRIDFLNRIQDQKIKSQVETLLLENANLHKLQNNPSLQNNSPQRLEPGTVIKRIRIDSLLGEGGMGSVYLGFDEKLERKVAIKAIRPEHLKNPATQQRFVREAQIMSKINHPAICQLYDYIEDELGDFLVMEFIDGQPLYKTALTEKQKLNVLADLAAALEVAHEFGIVHRDLKPDNIMINAAGKVKVLDFGIAQSMHQTNVQSSDNETGVNQALTQQGSLVGTIRYMSPEQAHGKPIDTASDIYAMGIIAQELFSHQAAYAVMETEQLLIDVQQGKRIVVADLPSPISSLVNELTQLAPLNRPTAAETKNQIKEIINAPKLKRQRLIKVSITSLVVVFVLALFWQWQKIGKQAARNLVIKDYENQIDQIIKQSEQIYVLPLHPVNQEIAQLLAEGEQLYADIEQNNSLSKTDKLRLQGIILLKAEYYNEAIPFLEQGLAEPLLLAAAWTQLYIEKATEQADLYGFDLTMQDTEFRTKYLQPALNYIDQAAQETGQKDPLFEAFVLSQVDSLEASLAAVDEILASEQWNKEAVKLKALILSAMMQSAKESGEWAKAQQLGQMTVETYALSAEMARSYPPSYQNLCYHQLNLMADAIQRTGQMIKHHANESIQACENALVALPEDTYSKQLLARTYLLLAQWQLNQGIAADESILLAKKWNEENNALVNAYNYGWFKALILTVQAKSDMMAGKAALPSLQEAVDLLAQLSKIDSEFRPSLMADYLFVLAQKAEWLVASGEDATSLILEAQALFDEAMLTSDLLVNEQWALVTNMAEIYWVSLMYEKLNDLNIESSADAFLTFLRPADNPVKNEPFHLVRLADIHALLAEYLWQEKRPVGLHLVQAQTYIQQALEINQTSYPILMSQANIKSLQAAVDGTSFKTANDLYDQASTLNPEYHYGLQAHAEHWLRQVDTNQVNREDVLKTAKKLIKTALKSQPENLFLFKTASEIEFLAAQSPIINQ